MAQQSNNKKAGWLARMKRVWRENRWIVTPAVIIMLVWVGSIWLQSSWSVETPQIYPPLWKFVSLRAAFPSRIPYEKTEIHPLSLWWVCPLNPCLDISTAIKSNNSNLQFALDGDKPVWETSLTFLMKGDGARQVILLRRAGPENTDHAKITVVTGGVLAYDIGAITLEGAQEAQWRKFGMGLLQTISVGITVIVAVFAGLKQLDEQKRNDRKRENEQRRNERKKEDEQKCAENKKKIDDFIGKTNRYTYERGKVRKFLEDSLFELNDWDDWEPTQQEKYRIAFLELIDQVCAKGTSQEVFSVEPSLWTQPAQQIVGKIQDKNPQALVEKLNQQAPDYSPELHASHFPPEKYPLQKRFAQQAFPAGPQAERLDVGIWQMRFPPFDDCANPFLYVQDGEFPLLQPINFPFDKNRFSHHTYFFQTTWDLRAGYYRYCRDFDVLTNENLRALSRRTFFVPVLAEEIPPWAETVTLEEHLLHNLAVAWLRLLANNPGVVDKVRLIEVEAISRLLAWHYGSAVAIQSICLPSDARILHHLQAIKPEKTLGAADKTRFLSLRPPGADHTLYLCAEISPAGKWDRKIVAHFPKKMAKAIETENLHIVRFLLGTPKEQAKVLKVCDQDLRKLLDERIRLSSTGTLQAFDGLFPPSCEELVDKFISRANGSPGTIIQMAHSLMERHIQQSPNKPDILPEALQK